VLFRSRREKSLAPSAGILNMSLLIRIANVPCLIFKCFAGKDIYRGMRLNTSRPRSPMEAV